MLQFSLQKYNTHRPDDEFLNKIQVGNQIEMNISNLKIIAASCLFLKRSPLSLISDFLFLISGSTVKGLQKFWSRKIIPVITSPQFVHK